jgi:hypothetical protein
MKILRIKCSGHWPLAKRPCFYLTLSPHQRTARGPAPQAQPVTLQEYFEDKLRCAWRPLRFSGHTRARQKQERAPLSHLRAMPLLVSDVSGCLTWRSAQREASTSATSSQSHCGSCPCCTSGHRSLWITIQISALNNAADPQHRDKIPTDAMRSALLSPSYLKDILMPVIAIIETRLIAVPAVNQVVSAGGACRKLVIDT